MEEPDARPPRSRAALTGGAALVTLIAVLAVMTLLALLSPARQPVVTTPEAGTTGGPPSTPTATPSSTPTVTPTPTPTPTPAVPPGVPAGAQEARVSGPGTAPSSTSRWSSPAWRQAVLYEPNDRYIEQMRAAEERARSAGLGLWAPPPPAPEPAAPDPAPEAPQPLVQAPQGGGSCDPSYPGVCIPPYPPDLDCGEIEYRRFEVRQPDPHGFDRDKDGVGCESD